ARQARRRAHRRRAGRAALPVPEEGDRRNPARPPGRVRDRLGAGGAAQFRGARFRAPASAGTSRRPPPGVGRPRRERQPRHRIGPRARAGAAGAHPVRAAEQGPGGGVRSRVGTRGRGLETGRSLRLGRTGCQGNPDALNPAARRFRRAARLLAGVGAVVTAAAAGAITGAPAATGTGPAPAATSAPISTSAPDATPRLVRIEVGDCVLEAPLSESGRLEELARQARVILPRVEQELGARASAPYRITLLPAGAANDPELRGLEARAPAWAAGFVVPAARSGAIRAALADRYPYADLSSV